MTDFDSTPVLLPWWRQSKKILPVAALALLLVPAVILVGRRQLGLKAASSISVQVSPGAIDQSSSPQIGKPVYLSATAVDEVGRPITSGVSYTWGISSIFSTSPTLTISDNLATFTPLSTGSGTLWVSAITSQSSAIKYLDICIGVPCPSYTNPTPTPTPTPRPTPTPTPTSTPTPAPTPTPTSTPTPTPRPTPTPTPISNTPPTIIPQFLPVGFVGKKYSASIAATDPDPYDNLVAQITGLPPLLKVTGCIQSSSTPNSYSGVQPPTVRNLVCTISGTPLRSGTFPVKITVTDSANASTTKTVNLFIFKKYILF